MSANSAMEKTVGQESVSTEAAEQTWVGSHLEERLKSKCDLRNNEEVRRPEE